MHRKAWIAIDRLSTICKNNLSDKIKREFFQAVDAFVQLYGGTMWTLTKYLEKKIDEKDARMRRAIFEKMLEAVPH